MLSPDAKALVEIDPKLQASKESVTRLEKLQTEKNEKMKDEALGEFCFLPVAVLYMYFGLLL